MSARAEHPEAVVRGGYDRVQLAEVRMRAPALSALADRLAAAGCPYPDALIDDVLALLFLAEPHLADVGTLTPDYRDARALLSVLATGGQVRALRVITCHDRWAAAIGVLILAPLLVADPEPSVTDTAADAVDEIHAVAVDAANLLHDAGTLSTAIGLDPGDLARMNVAERETLARTLAGHRLVAYAALIGRVRVTAAGIRAQAPRGRRRRAGVTLSGHLADVVGAEWAALGNRHTRLELLGRLAEGRLRARAWDGRPPAGAGPMIVLVDTSASMSDGTEVATAEAWAKAVALALADAAAADGRDLILVTFGARGELREVHAPGGRLVGTARAEFAAFAFDGGTDVRGALRRAVELIDQDPAAGADVVLLTDGRCHLGEAFAGQFDADKQRLGCRLFAVTIGARPSGELAGLADDVRTVDDLTDAHQVADLYLLP